MEWKLINIWDVVQTKTGVVGIVITKGPTYLTNHPTDHFFLFRKFGK